MQYTDTYISPIGKIIFASDGTALTGLWFEGQKYFEESLTEKMKDEHLPVFEETKRWLDCYFSGSVPGFTPVLRPKGSPFRMEVWKILQEIPYGKLTTYGEIARRMAGQRGLEKMSAQAVGGAVAHNPISIIIPCHRVVGSDGSLTGYAGGIQKKIELLKIEKANDTSGKKYREENEK
ncbi:MAG: methylated-DNA--[protein]-cysteine S-methyltransferase [Ruminococcus sp.]